MARVIANDEVWVGFATTVANIAAPTTAEVDASTDLTGYLVSLEATSAGNAVATPTLDTTFETSIPGTASATFTAELYRDDAADTGWTTLPRGTEGYFIISRFGTNGAAPASGDTVEVWPVRVISRGAVPLTSNDSQRFNIECSVPQEPDEDAVVTT